MPAITLSERDTVELLTILRGYAATQSAEIAQALADETAGKRTALFDNYTDFLAALEAQKSNAQRLLRDIQQQTSVTILNDTGIARL